METVAHPRLRPGVLEDRRYQASIAEAATAANTLAVLPTGLGKTTIALRLIAEYLRRFPTCSILFLAPTRPLVVQHADSVRRAILGPAPVVLTGAVGPGERADLLHPPQVIVATPQVIGNDLATDRFPLDTISLIVFDEAHRARGDYPYVAIARANAAGPQARVLAMTASPGSRLDTIREVWRNLGIAHFEYRTVADADVRPYVHDVPFESEVVKVPAEVQGLGVLFRARYRIQPGGPGEAQHRLIRAIRIACRRQARPGCHRVELLGQGDLSLPRHADPGDVPGSCRLLRITMVSWSPGPA